MSCGGRPVVFPWKAFGVRVRGGILRRYLGGGGHVLEKLIYIVKMWNKFQPERNLRSPIVIPNSWL